MKFSTIRIFLHNRIWFSSYVQFCLGGHFSEQAEAALRCEKMNHLKATFHLTTFDIPMPPCVKIKDTDDVLSVKEGRNSRDGNYSFEFFPLHAAHA